MEVIILSVVNKVIVTIQLQDGDSVDVSVKAVDKPLTGENKFDLVKKIEHSIKPKLDDMFYMKVRLTRDNKKDNWNKIHSMEDLMSILNGIFE